VNSASISAINTAWDARTGAYRPPVSRFSEGKAAIALVASGNGVLKAFSVAHTLAQRPTFVVAEGQNAASLLSHTVTTTATNIVVTYKVAPISGSSNISLVCAAAY
jgi:hypothetical protein